MKARLTQKLVENLDTASKDVLVWDDVVSGFGLRCRANGVKAYVVKYRKGRRQRWMKIGRCNHLKVEKAREMARSMLGFVADGGDPAGRRETERIAATVNEMAERFLDHARITNKPRTVEEYRRLIRLFVAPGPGLMRVADVQRADVARLHQELKDTPYQANRVLAVLSSMLNLADKLGVTEGKPNPCRHIGKFKERRVERYLSEKEFAALETAVTRAEREDLGTPYMWAAIRLLMLTGARLNEILTLKWDYVDFERRLLHLPDSKTGRKTIFLNGPAVAVLKGIKRLPGNPHVIVGKFKGEHLVDLKGPWSLIRKMAKLADLRLHDLRHSFASVAAGSGMSLPMIGALLGHKHPSTTARYAHLAAPLLADASDAVGRAIIDRTCHRRGARSSRSRRTGREAPNIARATSPAPRPGTSRR